MKNENGSAVVLVLLFLGIVSVVAAGLVLQSSVDRQFTSAVKSVDSLRDVASAAAGKAYWALKDVHTPPSTEKVDPYMYVQKTIEDNLKIEENVPNYDNYTWRLVYLGKGGPVAGFSAEAGGGMSYGGGTQYNTYWTAEGRGMNFSRGDSAARVQIAIVKKFSGGH